MMWLFWLSKNSLAKHVWLLKDNRDVSGQFSSDNDALIIEQGKPSNILQHTCQLGRLADVYETVHFYIKYRFFDTLVPE